MHKEQYKQLRKDTTNLAWKKKQTYYVDKLNTSNGKIIYSAVNKLLDKNQETVLPDSQSDKELADSFMAYFTEKIRKIRETFHQSKQGIGTLLPGQPNGKLSVFEAATSDEIQQIVSSHGFKTSPEDPIPADILKDNSALFIPIWTKLVNLSLSEGGMECLKSAVVIPLLKELDDHMDRDDKKNYRPVSNLQFLEKMIERIVGMRLNKHMSENNLNEDFQYGYKKGHSTETLLVKVVNDLLMACDDQKPSIVLLLDLSAAFDTVDQTKLLGILQQDIGVEGVALKWFASFLKGRTQRVKIGDTYSEESGLDYGVAQGSVLGPNIFNIYIRSLKKYIEPSKFSIFGFADDHQLLKSFLPILQVNALGKDIQHCFNLITEWMNEFFLRLNSNKTKILVIIPPTLRSTIPIQGTFIDKNCERFVH